MSIWRRLLRDRVERPVSPFEAIDRKGSISDRSLNW
jgi:hypothetical protein